MYSASVPVFVHTLGAMQKWLDKAQAHAEARKFSPDAYLTLRLAPDMLPFTNQIQIASDGVKGAVARLAGIQRAKRTPDLVPLAHPIALHWVTVDLEVTDDGVAITTVARTADRTGVEMEALTAVAVAGLALVDMVKAVDPGAVITDVRVEEKTGGKTGRWLRDK